jgi:hypothetical protein
LYESILTKRKENIQTKMGRVLAINVQKAKILLASSVELNLLTFFLNPLSHFEKENWCIILFLLYCSVNIFFSFTATGSTLDA